MCDLSKQSELDHLDQKTKSIVNGFIRTRTKQITQRIPNDINTLTLVYIDDHFMMNRGSYQWKIRSAQQIQRILSAQPNSNIKSDVFEMCGLQWYLKLCPNGNPTTTAIPGSVGLFVKLLIFPKEWQYILVHQTLICQETNTVSHHIVKYNLSATC